MWYNNYKYKKGLLGIDVSFTYISQNNFNRSKEDH